MFTMTYLRKMLCHLIVKLLLSRGGVKVCLNCCDSVSVALILPVQIRQHSPSDGSIRN